MSGGVRWTVIGEMYEVSIVNALMRAQSTSSLSGPDYRDTQVAGHCNRDIYIVLRTL